MTKRKEYYKKLKDEIINDPTKQGYDEIFRKNYKDPRDKYTKIAEQINKTRRQELGFPIIRSNIVKYVMENL